MKNNKEYTWLPVNQGTFSNTFQSIEDAIADAQDKFDKEYEEYEDGDEYNSHIITIGEVERYNVKSAVESIVDDIHDNLESDISDFAFGMDYESEAQILEQHKSEFKEQAVNALLPLIEKYFYFSPQMKSIEINQYNLKERKFVEQ